MLCAESPSRHFCSNGQVGLTSRGSNCCLNQLDNRSHHRREVKQCLEPGTTYSKVIPISHTSTYIIQTTYVLLQSTCHNMNKAHVRLTTNRSTRTRSSDFRTIDELIHVQSPMQPSLCLLLNWLLRRKSNWFPDR